ncbi:MAG: ABC transporter permease [Campylobacterota bacterium]|nr:ABC transporter permease [Campylobacterota bacterium]
MNCDISIKRQNDTSIILDVKGDWLKNNLVDVNTKLQEISSNIDNISIIFDFENTTKIDSAGIILVLSNMTTYINNNCNVTVINMTTEQKTLLLFYRQNKVSNKIIIKKEKTNIFYKIGKTFYTYLMSFMQFLNFVGENFYFFLQTLIHPSQIRFKAIIKQIDLSGIRALPIVILTSFLIGLVIAYQGAEQLQQFGANIFIVEMVSISVIRELAPMITAIVIAGRSASSFTAEIGTMKITQELDAMKTMGFEPAVFLVMPRIIALMIALPLIVFLADLVGIFGGMVVANLQLGISYTEFIDRLYTEVDIRHFLIGIAKAPIFGFIIALIGCYRGFQVTGSTDSIGKYTTISVVNAIFWVIALNAIFSVLFTQIGI